MRTGRACLALAFLSILSILVPSLAANQFALLIGINDYEYLGKLEECRADATELARVLIDRAGYDPVRLCLVTDGTKPEDISNWDSGSYAHLLNRFEQFTTLPKEGDTLLIFFAGHGLTIDNEAYLMPADGSSEKTGFAVSWLRNRIATCKAANKILVLDACHSGKAVRGVLGIAPSLASGAATLVVTSCAENEISWPDQGHGVFTAGLLDGLSGTADFDKDRNITGDELFRSVRDYVEKWCIRTGKTQTPQVFPAEPTDVVVARMPDESQQIARRDKEFRDILAAAEKALEADNTEEALATAEKALQLRPGDKQALLLKLKAERAAPFPVPLDVYDTAVKFIEKNYVYPITIDRSKAPDIRAVIRQLDPFSDYLPPQTKEELDVETTGQYGGVGTEIQLDPAGFLIVVTPLEGTPAFRSGILPGDKILKIDGKDVMSVPLAKRLTEAVRMMRGKPATPVTLTVLREAGASEDIPMTREIITTKSVRATKMLDEGSKIGYVRLSQFQQGTARELDAAVKQLQDQGMKALILDLRFNPGGLLSEAVAVCNRFLDEGVIVSTKGRVASWTQVFKADMSQTYPRFPVAILISGRSAAASEIVAGALQDHKRAVIVGMRSFGKGSVQTITALPGGAALRLTTALYYTPSGRCVHRDPKEFEIPPNGGSGDWGIKPDFEVPISSEEEMGTIKQWRDEHVTHTAGAKVTQEFLDRQLEKAKEVLK